MEKKPTALEAIESLLKASGMPQEDINKVMEGYEKMKARVSNETSKLD